MPKNLVSWLFVIISSVGSVMVMNGLSSCSWFRGQPTADIIMVGDCEHGLVSEAILSDVQKIWPLAQRTDVLIAGGCYQQYIIKAK